MNDSKVQNAATSFPNNVESGMDQPGSLTSERWLSSREAADILGISVGALTMKVHRGEIQPRKLGRLNRFGARQIDGLLQIPPTTSSKRRS